VRHAKAPGDEQAAYDFLNAMLDPESGKWLIEQQGYFHSNPPQLQDRRPQDSRRHGRQRSGSDLRGALDRSRARRALRSKYIELVNNVKAGL